MRLTGSRAAADSSIVVDESGSRTWTLAAVAAALGLVFALDRISGLAPVQHLYYIPIILASVRFGYRGSTTAAVAILLYHLANPRVITFQYTEGDVLQIALFVGIGVAAAKLANDRRRLHRLSITDDLTGLHNLRSFEGQLRTLLRNAVVYQLPVALLVLDLDRLNSLNDTHGHLAGAEAVRSIGHLIAGRLPAGGVACRYGGDEFVIAVPDSAAGKLYNKNGAWLNNNRTEQCVAYFMPQGMELGLFVNSPIGTANYSLRNLVKDAYVNALS
jgi:GGDEF domain-containing protein